MHEMFDRRIFLVDDHKISNFINRRLIEGCKFSGEVLTYEKPEIALQELEVKKPKLILLDINMPDIDGWKFLELMGATENANIKVIMVTSSTSSMDKMKAREYPQVLDYYVKPLSVAMVKNIIATAFEED